MATSTSNLLADVLRLAAHVCGVPIAVLQVSGGDVTPVTMAHGIDAGAARRQLDAWAQAFSALTALRVGDTADDRQFAGHPMVHGSPYIRAYAALPLLGAGGEGLGALYLLDPEPRLLSATAQEWLERVGGQAAAHVLAGIAAARRDAALRHGERGRAAVVASERQYRTTSDRIGGDGLDHQMALIARDISDRRRDERSLLASAQRFRRMVESLHDVLFETDAAGQWSYLNPAWAELTGFATGECLGKPIGNFVHGEDVELHEKQFRPLIQQQRKMSRYAVRFRTRNNGWRWFEVHARVIEEGHVPGTSGTLRDITEQRELSHAVVRAGQEALTASRMKSEFVANMSHEVRTPINGVIGLTTLLFDTCLTDEQRDLCEGIRSSAEALLTIVNDVLDLSKVEAGKLAIEPVGFVLRQALADALEPVTVKARKKGLQLLVNCAPAVPATVISDPTRIRQILINLVDNAIKFTHQGTVTVDISVVTPEAEKPRLRFSVADQGIGIRADKLDDIFEKFTQADSSTTRNYGGSGLGLAICRQLIALMDGHIGVSSQVGSGSTFWFELPLVEAVPAKNARATNGDAAALASGMHVLVAEDNTINQKVARRFLEKLGCVVEIVSNGEEALARVQDRAYTAVFMDCQMPKMDGYEATRQIRALLDQRKLPIIAMTAHAMRGDRERCLAAGMSDYLSKPLQPEALAAALERVKEGRHANEESAA